MSLALTLMVFHPSLWCKSLSYKTQTSPVKMSVMLVCLGKSSLFFRSFGTSLALGLLCKAGGMLITPYCAGDLLLLELFSETTLVCGNTPKIWCDVDRVLALCAVVLLYAEQCCASVS